LTAGGLSDPSPESTPHRIQDLPQDDRPRERLLRSGPQVLSDAELLALFINTGLPGENAIQVAQRLLRNHSSLRHLSRLDPPQLRAEKALGPAKAALLCAAFEIGRRAVREELKQRPLDTPERIYEFVAADLQPLSHEVVRVILVNTKLGFVRMEQISHGTVNESVAHPRDVVRPALMHVAYGFILVHNHPSGDPTPSDADRRLTRRVKEAADVLGLSFLDHIVIGTPAPERAQPYFSFREAGLL